jgi:hypothetical protein
MTTQDILPYFKSVIDDLPNNHPTDLEFHTEYGIIVTTITVKEDDYGLSRTVTVDTCNYEDETPIDQSIVDEIEDELSFDHSFDEDEKYERINDK